MNIKKICHNPKKKRIFLVFTFLLLIVVIGTSFSLWQLTLQQTGTNVITSGCLKLTLQNDSDAINLINASPLNDNDASGLTPYIFTVSNNCNKQATYVINLENVSVGDKILDDNYIKINLMNGKNQVFHDKLLDSYMTENRVIDNSSSAYKLYQGTLSGNSSTSFSLRIWLDKATPAIDGVMNANFSSKITVLAENEIKISTVNIPESYQDNGIFKDYYGQAYQRVQAMSLEEKVGQLLVVRYNASTILSDALKNYHIGGTTFYAVDFNGKTEEQVKEMIDNLQKGADIALITAVDEEGGRVVRVSSNPNLANEVFKAPMEIYEQGGMEAIKEDTIKKSSLLNNLGLNMNFAPVVDIASETSYIYPRTLGQTPEVTGLFASVVINASKGSGVSYSLKHFPGYGNNADTHSSSSTDETSMEELQNKHLVPFKIGIENGAEAVMIAHNIVSAIDKTLPASLSKPVHDLLFNDLHFTGIAITDDLDMDAAKDIEKNYTKAIQAGNNIILCSNYQDAFNEIIESVNDGNLEEEMITKLVFKVLSWKYYKGLIK